MINRERNILEFSQAKIKQIIAQIEETNFLL